MFDLLFQNAQLPWLWFGICVVLFIIEGFTLQLTTIWFAIGAFFTIFVSMSSLPLIYQTLFFTLISLVLFIFTRPLVMKKINVRRIKTNADSIVGKRVVVTKAITHLEMGEVKIYGVVWSAVAEDDADIVAGTECVVKRIEGVRLVISPIS